MRKKDLITIVVVVALIVVGGALLYRYIYPPTSSGITYEAPHPVNPSFNQTQLDALKARTDYTPNITPKAFVRPSLAFIVEASLGELIYRK